MADEKQLVFPFLWTAHTHAEQADKHMIKKRDRWGNITVHRNTMLGIWVVSKYVPIIGPSGLIGAAIWYVFPDLFHSGRKAHHFAGGLNRYSGPLLDGTFQ